jgi:3-oxoacyl-[acyl-carrier protein] reductase
MSDRYLAFVCSPLGRRLAGILGLPRPVVLDRFESRWPVLQGEVLIGAVAPSGGVIEALAGVSRALRLDTVAHDSAPAWTPIANAAGLMSGPWRVGAGPAGRLKALIFDATMLDSMASSAHLHAFFQQALPCLSPCSRIVVLARPPETCERVEHATMQRALEGFVRSLAKELGRGSTAQLVEVAPGGESGLTGVLGFLLSPRSAYVSGQVLRVSASGEPLLPFDPMEPPLVGRTLMVTGAARGIGEAIALTLARDGARVICVDLPQHATALDQLAQRVGGAALTLDITAADAAERLSDAAQADGGWDGVVHNAGITQDRRVERMPPERWQSVLSVNLAAPLAINQALLGASALKRGARIVVLSSIAGLAGNRGQTNYAFSKAGLVGLAQASARSFQDRGIAFNAVAPGFIETAMTAAIPFAIREAGRRMNSLAQGGQPIDVAEAVAWLASPAAAAINGQVLRVCGQSLLGA